MGKGVLRRAGQNGFDQETVGQQPIERGSMDGFRPAEQGFHFAAGKRNAEQGCGFEHFARRAAQPFQAQDNRIAQGEQGGTRPRARRMVSAASRSSKGRPSA